MFKTPTHVLISWVFLILIGIVFSYSYYFFPDAHPIDCWMKMKTGKDCPTCGFSRAFSFFTHFRFEDGRVYNSRALPVYLFFLSQFLIRLAVVVYYHLAKRTPSPIYVKSDIAISISTFLLAFLPLLKY